MKILSLLGILILVLAITGCTQQTNKSTEWTTTTSQAEDTVGSAIQVTQTVSDPAVQILNTFDEGIQTPDSTVTDVDTPSDTKILGGFDAALSSIQ